MPHDRPLPPLADDVRKGMEDLGQAYRLLNAYYDPLIMRPCLPPYDGCHYRLGTDTLLVVTDDGTVVYMRPCLSTNAPSRSRAPPRHIG